MVGPSACPLTPTPASHHNCLVVFVSSSSSSSSLHLVAACLRLSSRALSHNTHTSHPCGFRVVSTRHPPSHTATHAPSLRSRCGSRSGGPRHILRLLLLLLPHPTRPLPSARGRPCSTPCTCLRRPCACLRRPCAGATGGGRALIRLPPASSSLSQTRSVCLMPLLIALGTLTTPPPSLSLPVTTTTWLCSALRG